MVLAVTLALELVVETKSAFAVEGWFGFGAWFGFGSCLLMVLFAKGLGVLVKREEQFYDSDVDRDD